MLKKFLKSGHLGQYDVWNVCTYRRADSMSAVTNDAKLPTDNLVNIVNCVALLPIHLINTTWNSRVTIFDHGVFKICHVSKNIFLLWILELGADVINKF